MRDKGKELIDLASSEFYDSTQAELNLLEAVASGEFAWCGPSKDPENEDNNPEHADRWPKDREIRATLIRWLCVDQEASRLIDRKGLFIFAARIAGALDLSFANVAFPLDFKNCRFAKPLKLQFAEMKFLEFSRTITPEINADGIVVHGGLHMRHGFSARGEVRLVTARIGGQLDCTGGTFMKGPEDVVVRALR